MSELADAYLRLALVPGLGPITAQYLLDNVDKPQDIFQLNMRQLQAVDGIGPQRAKAICAPTGPDDVATERARAAAAGVRIITREEADYPKAFRLLNDPPLALWLRGEIADRDRLALSIVGPRRPSAYGHRQARRLTLGVARQGITIVSGLARGIDTVAHESSLEVTGRTIAIIGSGFNNLYPEENADLAERIIDGNGAIIGEYPLDTKPHAGNFPRRNRLVAAWGLATLVIEAGNRSGALITARLAGECGQQVLALPGPIDRPEHEGSNKLLRDGATLITCLDDIFEEVEPFRIVSQADQRSATRRTPEASLNDRERQIYQLMDDTPRTVDDISPSLRHTCQAMCRH